MAFSFGSSTQSMPGMKGIPHQTTAPSWMTPSNNVTGSYNAAVKTQGSDYDRIMKNYEDLLGESKKLPGKSGMDFVPLSPNFQRFQASPGFQRSSEMDDISSQLENMSQTGGYSDEELSSIRARGVSPIRAIYANAMQNLARQKNLSGGYAPNYGALQAKMAREQSSLMSDKMTDVNAGIADRVAQGKQFALSSRAPLEARLNELENSYRQKDTDEERRVNESNTAEADRINQFNASMLAELEKMNQGAATNKINLGMGATQGMQSLYGTTPALSNMFGNQVLSSAGQNINAANVANSARQNRANLGMDLSRMSIGGNRLMAG